MDILRNLNEPELVVRFQKLCGLKEKKIESIGSTNGLGDTSRLDDDQFDNTQDNDSHNGQTRHRFTHSRSPSNSSVSGSEETENENYTVENPFLYYLFQFGANLGNEIFYITFFPYWFWNIDGYVGRRICIFWCIFMYLGQATKDIVKWPRPASPPVFRLEKRYALEYGMPSTHSMVGAGVPFSILYFTSGRYIFPFELGLIVASAWCILVCLSRLYLGMHSVLDVIAGLLYVFCLMPIVFPFMDAIDEFILNHPFSPFLCVLVPLTLAVCYPTLDKWSTARGDTTVILAVCGGIGLGHWVCFQYGLMERATTPPPYDIIPPSWTWFGQMLMRLSIGVVILFSTRAIMKIIMYNVLRIVTGTSEEGMKSHQKLIVELPYKFCTYTMIAVSSVYLAPQVFRLMGIERPTYFTEI